MKPAKLISVKERSGCHHAPINCNAVDMIEVCSKCYQLCDKEVTLKIKLNKDSIELWKAGEVHSADNNDNGTRVYWKQVRLPDIGLLDFPTAKLISDVHVTQELLKDCKDMDDLQRFLTGRIDQTIENWLGQEKTVTYTVPFISDNQ